MRTSVSRVRIRLHSSRRLSFKPMGSYTSYENTLHPTGHSDRVQGCLIGGMCGDVLGCSVEGSDPEWIRENWHHGLKDFQDTRRGFGCYTDDTNMTIALASSLVRKRKCSAEDCAAEYGRMFQPWRGYGETAMKILQALKSGADYRKTGTMLIPAGSYANGGAMRIAPVGLVYRNADNAAMRKAVTDALLCTHVHPHAIDGAMIQALAVAVLCKTDPQSLAPASFLDTLAAAAETDEMKEKLALLREFLPTIQTHEGLTADDWAQHFNSPSWAATRDMAAALSDAFQIKATDAVAVTLLVFFLHWRQPENAVVCAVHLGGDTDTIASMVGALVGALHGRSWIPDRWINNLENDEYGRDMMVELARQLAELDVAENA